MTRQTHSLKLWPEYYAEVHAGTKKFELRNNDRDFKVGDTVFLEEWSPDTKEYTGRKLMCTITYVLKGPTFGLAENYVILSIDVTTQVISSAPKKETND